MFLVDLPHKLRDIEFYELQRVVCEALQVWPDEGLPPYYDAQRHIKTCEWFRIYQIVEGLYDLLRNKGGAYYYNANNFLEAVNAALVSNNLGWQLNRNGKVVTRGDEAFEVPKLNAIKIIEKPLPTDLPDTPGFM